MMMENVKKVLNFLASQERDELGDTWISGADILAGMDMIPRDINDALEIAINRGWVKERGVRNKRPVKFDLVMINAEGRLWIENV